MTHHHDPEVLRIESRAARHRRLYRLLGCLLGGLGVICLALVIPVWGGIRYAVYVGQVGVPEFRLHMGFLIIVAGVVLLGLAWYFYYRAPRLEDLREVYAKVEIARRQARQRLRVKVLDRGANRGDGPSAGL